ncbi:MAG: TRAP transporter small permease subunit [Woeseiaceae bacterium]|jgi:TRAP-type mannitol/chloroaromatic compound transport system permease small subunit|nr:TRAP transporter small permease subunit [Woeseiaceae bacterium]
MTPQNLFDRISNITGKATSWLTLAMVILTSIIVVMRYVFDAGLIWMQESVTWMHAAVFMVGAAYTLLHEEHVRVDIFYRKMSERNRAIVDLIGVVLFLLPLCGLLALMAYDFAAAAWSIHETSREPGGLPYPMIPLMKSIVIVMPVAVALQGISMLTRSITTIRRQ